MDILGKLNFKSNGELFALEAIIQLWNNDNKIKLDNDNGIILYHEGKRQLLTINVFSLGLALNSLNFDCPINRTNTTVFNCIS